MMIADSQVVNGNSKFPQLNEKIIKISCFQEKWRIPSNVITLM